MKQKGCKSKLGLVLSLITCLLFLPGCWGKREVEQLAPLLGVGFDLGEKPGTYTITQQFAQPKKGGETGAEINDRTFSIEASSAREAIEELSRITYRTPFMGSLKVIIIGEDLAKAGGFNDILDFAQRFSEFRRSMYIILAKGKAQDILNMKLRTGLLPSLAIKDTIEGGKELSSYPTVRLGHYLTILSDQITAPIFPVVQGIKSGKEIQYKTDSGDEAAEIEIKGAGVLRGDRLVDYLTDEESKGYLWLNNDVYQRFISTGDFKEDGVFFSGQVIKTTTKYQIRKDNGTEGIHYQIQASVNVDEILGLKKQLNGGEWVQLMQTAEAKFAQVIEKECNLSLKKERELGLDFLGIGRHLEQRNYAYWKTVKDHWEEDLHDFPVSLEVHVLVYHSGMSSSSAVNSQGEGQE